MRLVSQYRDLSVDFQKSMIYLSGDHIIVQFEEERHNFGRYSSEQRAKEVFQDMHNAYAPVGIVSTNLNVEQCAQFIGSENVPMKIIQMNEPNTGITTYENYIYYMPEE